MPYHKHEGLTRIFLMSFVQTPLPDITGNGTGLSNQQLTSGGHYCYIYHLTSGNSPEALK